MTPISLAGLRPQARQVKLSRRRTSKRSRIEGFRGVRFLARDDKVYLEGRFERLGLSLSCPMGPINQIALIRAVDKAASVRPAPVLAETVDCSHPTSKSLLK